MSKWIIITELAKKENVSYKRIYNLLKKGLPHKIEKVNFPLEKVVSSGKNWTKKEKKLLQTRGIKTFIDYEAWLEIPAFLRQSWVKKNRSIKKEL